MVGTSTTQGAGANPHHHRCSHLSIRHVANPCRLQDDLAGCLEHEVGEHQIGDGARSSRRGAERSGGETLLGDWGINHACRPEFVPKALGVGKASTAFAGALAKIQNVRITAHLLGYSVANRIEPANHRCFATELRAERRGRIDRIRIKRDSHRRRIRCRCLPRKSERILYLLFDSLIDAIKLRARSNCVFLQELVAEHPDRISFRPGVDFRLGTIGAGDRIALVMADNPIGFRFDQRWTIAVARPRNRRARDFTDRKHVIAIDGNTGNAIGFGFACDVGVEGRQ